MASESPDAVRDTAANGVAPKRGFSAKRALHRAYEEIGLANLVASPTDIKLICLQRFVRLFAYGMSTLVFVPYLTELGFESDRVGLLQTLTLVFDVFISWFLTTMADGVGRRATLALGSVMMCGSGVVFAVSGNYWVLLAGAVFGMITPSGNEIGPFRAIEESTVSWLTPKANRGDIFAWYTLLGTAGMALGTAACGFFMDQMQHSYSWSTLEAQRGVYAIYAGLGVVKLILSVTLSRKSEIEKEQETSAGETAPLLADPAAQAAAPRKRNRLLPSISRESVPIVAKLSMLFALDSFGSGLISLTWIEYFFISKFGLSYNVLGTIFFTSSIIAAASVLVASSIAKRFGNIKTMVFTHLPSSVMLGLIPVPSSLALALTLLIVRSCTQSMDVAPRAAFLAAVIQPKERTAINGILNVVKTAATAGAPTVTGLLVKHGYFWVAFVAAGALKTSYDLGILAVFATTEAERSEDNE